MIPLFPASVMLYSSDSSNQSNCSVVTMSPALCGSTHTSVPSLICHPGRTPSFLKLCQPLSVLPSKSSFQPAAFSASLRVLGGALAPVSAAFATRMPPCISIPKTTIIIANIIIEFFISLLLLGSGPIIPRDDVTAGWPVRHQDVDLPKLQPYRKSSWVHPFVCGAR